jgi:hypothetical protein
MKLTAHARQNAEVKNARNSSYIWNVKYVNNIVLAHKFLKGFLHPQVPALISVVQSHYFRFSELLFFHGEGYIYTPKELKM